MTGWLRILEKGTRLLDLLFSAVELKFIDRPHIL